LIERQPLVVLEALTCRLRLKYRATERCLQTGLLQVQFLSLGWFHWSDDKYKKQPVDVIALLSTSFRSLIIQLSIEVHHYAKVLVSYKNVMSFRVRNATVQYTQKQMGLTRLGKSDIGNCSKGQQKDKIVDRNRSVRSLNVYGGRSFGTDSRLVLGRGDL